MDGGQRQRHYRRQGGGRPVRQGPPGQRHRESAIKPEYTGDGTLVLEPTYKHILLLDLADWNGSIVLDDGLFLACDSRLKHKAVMRSNFSSAAAGNEGLFNLGIVGSGVVCLESFCPKEELVEITLQDDVLKVDGNMAIAWSGSLNFTVERSGKSLVGSAASGEGLVNVYRGTGRVLLAPFWTVRSDLKQKIVQPSESFGGLFRIPGPTLRTRPLNRE